MKKLTGTFILDEQSGQFISKELEFDDDLSAEYWKNGYQKISAEKRYAEQALDYFKDLYNKEQFLTRKLSSHIDNNGRRDSKWLVVGIVVGAAAAELLHLLITHHL